MMNRLTVVTNDTLINRESEQLSHTDRYFDKFTKKNEREKETKKMFVELCGDGIKAEKKKRIDQFS